MRTTVRLGEGRSPKVLIREFTLEIVKGAGTRRVARFTSFPVKVGKDPGCDLVLEDPAISRHHLQIEEGPDGYVVRDLESTNGTRIKGTPVREAYLAPGTILDLGSTALRFDAADRSVAVVASGEESFHGLVGRSRAMRELFAHLKIVAPTPLSVLLLGETGCGKELVARALHDASPRVKAPFTIFDCGSIDRELLGAALFGHDKGAYTGATGSRRGAFQAAHGGTLFLDEIGDLPLDVQSRLLGALERRAVQPLGSDQFVKVDVRVVAATHRDLEAMAADGRFRQDLLFRLAGLMLHLPPLRERVDDVGLLAEHLLGQVRPDLKLGEAARRALEAFGWPGNVRELKNVIERAAAFARGSEILPEDLMLGSGRTAPAAPAPASPPTDAPVLSLNEAEVAALRAALRSAGGNKSKVARLLGIGRNTLRDKMQRHGIADEEP